MKTPRKIRLFICIIWVLVGIALVFCVQFNKHNLKVQPVISKIVLGYVITSMILAGFLHYIRKK